MISKINPMVLAMTVAAVLGGFLFIPDEQGRSAAKTTPLPATLYKDGMVNTSSGTVSIGRDMGTTIPRIEAYVDPAVELGVAGASMFLVSAVDHSASKYKVVPIETNISTQPIIVQTITSTTTSTAEHFKNLIPIKKKAKVAAPAAPALADNAAKTETNVASATAPVAATPARTREEEPTYKKLNEIIQDNAAAYTTSQRYKNGDVTFRAYLISKWKDKYLVKFGVLNEGGNDFFISNVVVTAAGKPVRAFLASVFSCRPEEEVFCIVQVAVKDVEGKKVAFEMRESGGKMRKFPLKIEYEF